MKQLIVCRLLLELTALLNGLLELCGLFGRHFVDIAVVS